MAVLQYNKYIWLVDMFLGEVGTSIFRDFEISKFRKFGKKAKKCTFICTSAFFFVPLRDFCEYSANIA